MFFASSADGGQTWSEPVLVSRSGTERGFRVRMVATPQGRIHLVWTKQFTSSLGYDALWHAFSDDGGATWSAPIEALRAASGHNLFDFRVVGDQAGRLHLLITSDILWATGENRLLYGVWDNEDWAFEEIPTDNMTSTPALAIDEHDQLHLVYTREDALELDTTEVTFFEIVYRTLPLQTDTGTGRQPAFFPVVLSNHPNPFSDSTTITFTVGMPASVVLNVYSLDGSLVRRSDLGFHTAGTHRYDFHSRNLASGVYFYHLCSGSACQTGSMVLVR